MYLFFDTETTGLPKDWKAPITDFNNWPRLVQLAFLTFDKEGNKINSGNYIIKPEGFLIPKESSAIHRITNEKALNEGVSLSSVLDSFKNSILQSDYLVAHNISFDEKIIGAEFLRIKMENFLSGKKKICTMEQSTNYCKLDGPYGFKWPKLSELYLKLFNSYFEESHNAEVDINATAKCFWELKKLGIIKY